MSTITNNKQNLPIRVSVSEAERLFGVSSKTIRLAIKNNEVLYIITRGRYKINFESLLAWSQKSTRRHNRLQNRGLGQFVERWHIHNKKYSPSPQLAELVTTNPEVDKKDHQVSENQSDL